MSISSDVDISRKDALDRVFRLLMSRHEDLIIKAVNSMDNLELASYLHTDMYYYHVSGRGKLKESWERD